MQELELEIVQNFFLANKNAQVFALDASDSVDFAYKKYGKLSNVHFLQADLRQLPFKKSFFDYIYSDQVLHHTKNTGTSFKYLVKFLTKSRPYFYLRLQQKSTCKRICR